MFEAKQMLFIYVETPLHAGTGPGLGAIDLPIQRERITDYPMIQASGLKGRVRAEVKGKIDNKEWLAIFGPETGENASDHAGALSLGDARILLFPVRSLAGVFAWVTSRYALARFMRDAHLVGLPINWDLPPEPNAGASKIWVSSDKSLIAGESVVLEEFSFTPDISNADLISKIGTWLADNALPQTDEYKYWREALPRKLCIMPEDAFRDFVLYGTEVQTHIRIDPNKKTVQTGALWTTESLPVDTLLYAPIMATKSRAKDVTLSAEEVLQKVINSKLSRTQLGGDETTGQGFVALTFSVSQNSSSNSGGTQ